MAYCFIAAAQPNLLWNPNCVALVIGYISQLFLIKGLYKLSADITLSAFSEGMTVE